MFCGRCETSLTYQHADDPDVVEITTATLDRPDTFALTREVFTEEKIVWELLHDGLEHYPWSSTEGLKKGARDSSTTIPLHMTTWGKCRVTATNAAETTDRTATELRKSARIIQ